MAYSPALLRQLFGALDFYSAPPAAAAAATPATTAVTSASSVDYLSKLPLDVLNLLRQELPLSAQLSLRQTCVRLYRHDIYTTQGLVNPLNVFERDASLEQSIKVVMALSRRILELRTKIEQPRLVDFLAFGFSKITSMIAGDLASVTAPSDEDILKNLSLHLERTRSTLSEHATENGKAAIALLLENTPLECGGLLTCFDVKRKQIKSLAAYLSPEAISLLLLDRLFEVRDVFTRLPVWNEAAESLDKDSLLSDLLHIESMPNPIMQGVNQLGRRSIFIRVHNKLGDFVGYNQIFQDSVPGVWSLKGANNKIERDVFDDRSIYKNLTLFRLKLLLAGADPSLIVK